MEIFKPIKEYPAYSVSTEGRVMKNSTRQILTPSKKPNGYMQINLFTGDGRRKKEYVHRLVAIAFIPNPQSLPEVNHIDGKRDNNELSNLEWVSRRENIDKSGLRKPICVYRKTGELVGEYQSVKDACAALDLTGSNVSDCLRGGRQKTHRGYTFKFK